MSQTHRGLELWLDKRYTKDMQRRQLERYLRDEMVDLPEQALVLYQEDWRTQAGLQVVDHICWAFYRKYERRDPSLSLALAERS